MKSLAATACIGLALAASASGCATVFNSRMGGVMVQSRTPGAQVLVDGMMAGQTPMIVPVSADRPHTITVNGAAGQFTCMTQNTIGVVWVVLDVLFGVFPLVVDAVTGAWGEPYGDCFAPV